MEENQIGSNKKSIIVSIVVLAVVAAALLYYFYREDQTPFESLGEELENSQTGAESAIPPSANPLELTTPEATPVEKTNPFKYENPFE